MSRKLHNILITGGAGFIGSNFIHYLFGMSSAEGNLFDDADFDGTVVNVDCLTYAGNLESLKDIEEKFGGKRYFFEKVDICDRENIERIFKQYDIDTVIHFAAESHVDRSILGPEAFMKTNVMGTFTLLDVALNYWKKEDGSIRDDVLFHHISTDEVYGSLGSSGTFIETSNYSPNSPYSASKASAELMVMAYWHTYGLPVTISNCSNNYGPYQDREKFIPLMISNMAEGLSLPLYGNGNNVRDWIYVEDHNNAVWTILKKGRIGQKYNIGSANEIKNNELLQKLIEKTSVIAKRDVAELKRLIKHVNDRPGHDFRYSIDATKIKEELGWKPLVDFETGLEKTVRWYLHKL